MDNLNKKIIITGKIHALSGIHIGGTNSAMGIGGPDAMIVRNPISNKPYVPGSSLKGKMRSLIELQDDTIKKVNMGHVSNGPTDNKDARATKLFGATGEYQQPSRIIVRDGELVSVEGVFSNTDLPYTESKTEVVIDRITSAAMPRQIERVPAGAVFSLDMIVNVFESNEQDELMATMLEALQLLSDDYLGGNGSRGSGKVAFEIEKLAARNQEYYQTGKGEEDLTGQYQEYIDRLHRHLPKNAS
jgi:CRISPR-associated protein Csm3